MTPLAVDCLLILGAGGTSIALAKMLTRGMFSIGLKKHPPAVRLTGEWSSDDVMDAHRRQQLQALLHVPQPNEPGFDPLTWPYTRDLKVDIKAGPKGARPGYQRIGDSR